MAKITVPMENRPSFGKYAAYTAIGIFLTTAVVGSLARGVQAPVFGFGVALAGGLLNVAILFLMIQSLVEEWFSAAEIVEE